MGVRGGAGMFDYAGLRLGKDTEPHLKISFSIPSIRQLSTFNQLLEAAHLRCRA